MPDPMGEEGDFIVKSKPEAKQIPVIHASSLSAHTSTRMHVSKQPAEQPGTALCVQVLK